MFHINCTSDPIVVNYGWWGKSLHITLYHRLVYFGIRLWTWITEQIEGVFGSKPFGWFLLQQLTILFCETILLSILISTGPACQLHSTIQLLFSLPCGFAWWNGISHIISCFHWLKAVTVSTGWPILAVCCMCIHAWQ